MTQAPDFTGKSVLLSSFRNEAPFVLEFVAHHRMLGFDEIVIASNDCTDGTDLILQALDRAGVIRHLPCQPGPRDAPQPFAWAQARARLPLDQAEWLMILDADEFLNIHHGAGRLADLLALQPEGTDLCLVQWACFGASGQLEWRPGFSMDLYPLRLASHHPDNGMVKALRRRPAQWGDLGNHHPHDPKEDRVYLVTEAAGLRQRQVPAAALTARALNFITPTADCHQIAQINHYATRSADCFDLRRKRGNATLPLGAANTRHQEGYFNRLSRGRQADRTIDRYRAEFEAAYNDLAADPATWAAHEAGLAAYRKAIHAYWQDRLNSSG